MIGWIEFYHDKVPDLTKSESVTGSLSRIDLRYKGTFSTTESNSVNGLYETYEGYSFGGATHTINTYIGPTNAQSFTTTTRSYSESSSFYRTNKQIGIVFIEYTTEAATFLGWNKFATLTSSSEYPEDYFGDEQPQVQTSYKTDTTQVGSSWSTTTKEAAYWYFIPGETVLDGTAIIPKGTREANVYFAGATVIEAAPGEIIYVIEDPPSFVGSPQEARGLATTCTRTTISLQVETFDPPGKSFDIGNPPQGTVTYPGYPEEVLTYTGLSHSFETRTISYVSVNSNEEAVFPPATFTRRVYFYTTAIFSQTVRFETPSGVGIIGAYNTTVSVPQMTSDNILLNRIGPNGLQWNEITDGSYGTIEESATVLAQVTTSRYYTSSKTFSKEVFVLEGGDDEGLSTEYWTEAATLDQCGTINRNTYKSEFVCNVSVPSTNEWGLPEKIRYGKGGWAVGAEDINGGFLSADTNILFSGPDYPTAFIERGKQIVYNYNNKTVTFNGAEGEGTISKGTSTQLFRFGVEGNSYTYVDEASTLHFGGGGFAKDWTVIERAHPIIYSDTVNGGTFLFDGNDTSRAPESKVPISAYWPVPYIIGGHLQIGKSPLYWVEQIQ